MTALAAVQVERMVVLDLELTIRRHLGIIDRAQMICREQRQRSQQPQNSRKK
jgi:hypothetical protein